jgi:multisubunit Na+/H+ antiporter MnhC subunit
MPSRSPVVVYLVVGLGQAIDAQAFRLLTGCLLIGWGAYYLLYGHRHRVRIGLRTGYFGLGIWSFLMATAHGAGLMLIPALMPLKEHAEHMHPMPVPSSIWIAALAVAVHTAAMLSSPWSSMTLLGSVGLGFAPRH